MRLLIVGTLRGQLTLATKLAMDKGATVTHADGAEMALRVLRSGRSADLLMVEVANHSPERDGTYRHFLLPVDPELRPLHVDL